MTMPVAHFCIQAD